MELEVKWFSLQKWPKSETERQNIKLRIFSKVEKSLDKKSDEIRNNRRLDNVHIDKSILNTHTE